MSIVSKIKSAFGGGITPSKGYKKIEYTAKASVTITTSDPANTPKIVSITLDPQLGSVQKLQVYKNETWVIEDMYVKTAPGVDGLVRFVKNDTELIFQSNPLSVYDISNPSRPRPPRITLKEFESLQVFYLPEKTPASDTTVEFYLKLVRYKPVE